MARIYSFVGFFILTQSFVFSNNDTCKFFIDLNKFQDQKLEVVFSLPEIKSDTIVYRLPTTVPGTYEILNFGRFVSEFKAINKDGSLFKVDSIDVNSWRISNAKRLDKIVYMVEDTWHSKKQGVIFEPAGTNIEPQKNIVLNTFGFVGYIDGLKSLPIALSVNHSKFFFGSTAMTDLNASDTSDVFITPDYIRLADSPIMYCEPDTSILHIGSAEVLVSVYSQNKKVSSHFISEKIEEILNAQKNYLGGELPIKKYAFIIYLFAGNSNSGSTGALEHSYSSFYYLEEISPDDIVQNIRDVAAHEFFHIVTPLGIHSREIGNFDYANPQMSEHLWLYEGVTEYFAGNVQVRNKIISNEKYLNIIKGKLENAERYNDTLPFTTMSKFCLDKYKDEYANVYEKGALIGMCLDVKLLSCTNGKYALNQLMMDLFKKYGPDKSFSDDELIDTIVKMTCPSLKDFFEKYINGPQPLPIEEVLAEVGINYEPRKKVFVTKVLGGAQLGFDPDKEKFFIYELTSSAKKIGFKVNDELVLINKTPPLLSNVSALIKNERDLSIPSIDINVVIFRKNIFGKKKERMLSYSATGEIQEQKFLSLNNNCSDAQMRLRNAWLGKN